MESRIIQPKIEIVDRIPLMGHIKATYHRASNGFKPEVVHDEHNTINAALKNHIAGNFAVSANKSMAAASLFPAATIIVGAAQDTLHGIKFKDSLGDGYVMKCTGTAALDGYTLGWTGSSASRKLTGEFVGYAITIATAGYILLGYNYDSGAEAFDTGYASASSWSSLAIASILDYLYIEWTLTVA